MTQRAQDETSIAKALLAAYPARERAVLGSSDIAQLVQTLPEFSGTVLPVKKCEAILWHWIRLADCHDGGSA